MGGKLDWCWMPTAEQGAALCGVRTSHPPALAAPQSSTLFDGARQRFLDALLAAARVEAYLPNVSVAANRTRGTGPAGWSGPWRGAAQACCRCRHD